MNLFQPIYSSSLIYPKDEEKKYMLLMLIESPQKVHDKTLRGCAGLSSTLLTEALPTRTVPPLQQCAPEEMPEANKGGRGWKGYGSFGLSSLQSSTSEKWVMAPKPGTSPSAPQPPPA